MSKVSVIIPFFNEIQYIEQCVSSVLTQTYEDYDIFIIDDKSIDENRNRLHELYDNNDKITILEQETNKGPSSCRNLGISTCTSEYILPLDADNYLKETESLSKFVNVIKDNNNCFVYSWVEFVGGANYINQIKEYNLNELKKGNYIDTCAMFRKDDWSKVGGYDENIKGLEDWDLWLMFSKINVIGKLIKEPLFCYRYRNDSITRTTPESTRARLASIIRAK